MKILQLLGNTAFGGATLIVSKISQKLREDGHEIIIMANDNQTKMHFEKIGFNCDEIKHMGRSIHPYKDLMSLMELKKYIKINKIDVIQSHTTKGGIYSRSLKMIQPSSKVIHTVHGYYLKMDGSKSDKLTLLIEKFFYKFADHITFVNGFDYELVKNWKSKANRHLIYNGVDLSKFNSKEAGQDKESIIIGISARIVHEKGYREFVELIKHFKNKPNIKFEILGEVDEEYYKSQVAEVYEVKNIADQNQVRFHGYVSDVLPLLSRWDINVLPSYREGLSISLLEALALGVPSVATAIRGNVEIVKNGKTGILVPVRNSEALINGVEKLMTSSDLRKAMSEKSQIRAKDKFNQEKMLDLYSHLFKTMNRT